MPLYNPDVVSAIEQTALDLKAPKAAPAFTGLVDLTGALAELRIAGQAGGTAMDIFSASGNTWLFYPWFEAKLAGIDITIGDLLIDGVKVVGNRVTGWTAATGTAQRTGFATYTAPDIDAVPSEAQVQAIADHLQALSRELKALTDDLITHGLIGT